MVALDATVTSHVCAVLSSAVSLGLEGVSRAERADLAARHVATVGRAVAFLAAQEPRTDAAPLAPLLDRLLATLLPGEHELGQPRGPRGSAAHSACVAACSGERARWWTGFGGGGEAAAALRELFWWAASPAPGLRPLQPRLLRALYLAPPAALQQLTPPDPPSMRKVLRPSAAPPPPPTASDFTNAVVVPSWPCTFSPC